MAKYLWSILAILIALAIIVPCVTFYVVLKEYWVKVADLHQDLLICRLQSYNSNQRAEDIKNILQQAEQGSVPTSLPLQSPVLIQADQYVQTTYIPQSILPSPTPPSVPTSTKSSEPTSRSSRAVDDVPKGRNLPEKVTFVPNSLASPLTDQQGHKMRRNKILKLRGHQKDVHNIEPSSESSQNATVVTTNESDIPQVIKNDKSYMRMLESHLRSMTGRLGACRKCLSSSNKRSGECGVGTNWKEFRAVEKTWKKQMKFYKRRKRKGKRRIKKMTDTRSTAYEALEGAPTSRSSGSPDASQDEAAMRETHRVSTDFRRGFNQKIVRMDEALSQFSATQSSFCKELRENLGSRLGKRSLELQALSNQITSLVRTTTAQVSHLEKLMSSQVYTAQQSIDKNLQNTLKIRDEQIDNIKSFHKKTFLPSMLSVAALLGDQASVFTNMGVDLITKVEMLQDSYVTFATKQSDFINKMAEAVNLFIMKHNASIVRSREHAEVFKTNGENFIRKIQERIGEIVGELVLLRLHSTGFSSSNNATYGEIMDSITVSSGALETLGSAMKQGSNASALAETDFRQSFSQNILILTERIEAGISQSLMHNHAAVNQIGETELETRAFTHRAESAWSELYANQETELRQEADMLANNLRSHSHHTQNILTGLQSAAETHEQVLEQQRMDFQNFVHKRQDALETQCTSISDWAVLMSSELRRRDQDLHRFLSEELRFSPACPSGSERNAPLPLANHTLLYESQTDSIPEASPTHDMNSPQSKTKDPTVEDSQETNPPNSKDASGEDTLSNDDDRSFARLRDIVIGTRNSYLHYKQGLHLERKSFLNKMRNHHTRRVRHSKSKAIGPGV